MKIPGLILLIMSWSSILVLCAYCFYKVLRTTKKNIHAPLDLDTGDIEDKTVRQ